MPDQEEVSPVLHSLCSNSPFVVKPERDRSLSCATTLVHSSSLRSSTTYKMMDYSTPMTDSSIQVYQGVLRGINAIKYSKTLLYLSGLMIFKPSYRVGQGQYMAFLKQYA
ncbi:hypothetical protein AAC387_Pa05g0929 [Persea americana]